MKNLIAILFATLTLTATVANAQTYYQGNELPDVIGDYNFTTGSTGFKETTGSRDQSVLVRPEVSGDPAPIANTDDANIPGFWNERCQTFAYVNADCTVQSINPGNLGHRPAVYGTETITTCNRSEVTLDFVPGSGFTVDFSSSSRDGVC